MKNKKSLQISALILLLSIFTVTLTGCMSARLRSDGLSKKLLIDGYRISFVSATQVVSDVSSIKISEIMLAEGKTGTAKEGYAATIYYCRNYESANTVETKCKNAASVDEKYKNFITYRYNYIVVHGNYEAVQDVRGY